MQKCKNAKIRKQNKIKSLPAKILSAFKRFRGVGVHKNAILWTRKNGILSTKKEGKKGKNLPK